MPAKRANSWKISCPRRRRKTASHAEGRGFESHHPLVRAPCSPPRAPRAARVPARAPARRARLPLGRWSRKRGIYFAASRGRWGGVGGLGGTQKDEGVYRRASSHARRPPERPRTARQRRPREILPAALVNHGARSLDSPSGRGHTRIAERAVRCWSGREHGFESRIGLLCIRLKPGSPGEVSDGFHGLAPVKRPEVDLRGVDPAVVHQRL
jgi:hypothetical protein